uniref:Iron complex outermembrane recepter protein n=1 Tax=uncultured bacterium AST3 TaxID=1328262 RepID=R9UQ26_9BACT|nr:iron complex outermembrane recepter protein [uncultured bacterium AST3]
MVKSNYYPKSPPTHLSISSNYLVAKKT